MSSVTANREKAASDANAMLVNFLITYQCFGCGTKPQPWLFIEIVPPGKSLEILYILVPVVYDICDLKSL